jgi:hypothetical protein
MANVRLIEEGNSVLLTEPEQEPQKLVLSIRGGPQGERRFYLNGVWLKQMLPEWTINGIGQSPVHFTCTLEVQLDLQDDDPQGH